MKIATSAIAAVTIRLRGSSKSQFMGSDRAILASRLESGFDKNESHDGNQADRDKVCDIDLNHFQTSKTG